jgi:hypothetical protein
MSNGSDEWSPLSTARTVSNCKMSNDEDKEDKNFATTRAPQIKREIVRKTVDDIENALCGIGSIYKIGKTLGEGSFATVKEATHKLTGAVVAIKIIERLDSDKFEEQEVVLSCVVQNRHGIVFSQFSYRFVLWVVSIILIASLSTRSMNHQESSTS